jgi:glycosyltransferase involved in cell wall biosynthesis
MPPISATLITYNEALDLPQALASLQGVADEVVVVDSGSSDQTCRIAREAGARVLSRAFTDFGDQKNFAASQAAHPWIFSLDADEALSPELRASLLEWKQTVPARPAYEVTRKTNFLGGWIRHSGWYPEYRVRLYRRDAARFVGALHETVRSGGPPGRLRGDLFHYTVRTLKEHNAKLEVFTDKAAEDLYARGRRRWRAGMFLAAPWTVVRKFVFQRGFLDGRRGALIAWAAGRYVWMKYRKLGVLLRGGKLQRRQWPQAGDA